MKNDATEETVETDDSKFSRLRFYNFGMGILHLVQGILMFILSSDFSLPISTLYLKFNVEATSLTQNLQTIGNIRLGPLVAAFLFISSFAHFFVSTIGFSIYKDDLKKGLNRARWYEYAFSASVMIVVISMLVGVYDLSSLILIFFLNASMILFGMVQELYTAPGKDTDWRPFIWGSIMGLIPWVVIALYLFGTESTAGTSVPGFVYGIFASIFVFFNVFAINMILQYKKVGPWKNYLFGEKVYIFLSLFAKSALAWQVFAGTLRPM
ncbi:heliorhodopsin HeR [Candidatus Bipolaricaulota bacterium]|nr:heliorhodopsin HeR [Candidatus Bipolaricaulota bacterium]